MHNHTRADGLSWGDKQSPNLRGFKQQWVISSHTTGPMEVVGRLLTAVLDRFRLKEILLWYEQKAYWLLKFPLGTDTLHFHSYFIGLGKLYSHAWFERGWETQLYLFPGQRELEHLWTVLVSIRPQVADGYKSKSSSAYWKYSNLVS